MARALLLSEPVLSLPARRRGPPAQVRVALVRNYPHPHGAYLRAFRNVRLEVIECLEAPMETDFNEGMFAEVADAAFALWEGIPAALLWSLRKPEVSPQRGGT